MSISPDYYVLWNTNEGAKYYKAEKTGEKGKNIYVKYDVAGKETSFFARAHVNTSTNDDGLYEVLTSDHWAAHMLVELGTPPEGASQVANQTTQGGRKKRTKRRTKKRTKRRTKKRTKKRTKRRKKRRYGGKFPNRRRRSRKK